MQVQPAKFAAASRGSAVPPVHAARLLRSGHHVIDRRLDVRVRNRELPTLGRHRALALEGVRVERVHPALQARGPSGFVAKLRRAGHAGAGAGATGAGAGAARVGAGGAGAAGAAADGVAAGAIATSATGLIRCAIASGAIAAGSGARPLTTAFASRMMSTTGTTNARTTMVISCWGVLMKLACGSGACCVGSALIGGSC